MNLIRVHISGVPYGQEKARGDKQGPIAWSKAVESQTRHLPKVTKPCLLRVSFLLPPDKFPKDHPFGSDLDNLLKRFCDALIKTVFSEAPGGDGCVVAFEASKSRVAGRDAAGADLEILSWHVT